MGPHWQAVLGCLCLVLSSAFSAAVPTPDTMVVAKADDGDSTPTLNTDVTEGSTEGPSPPIKLTEMAVTSQITMRYAHTAVVTTVRNPAQRAQEATFRVLLPETAFISSFTMILDGKPYKAYVKEKEEAKQIYNQAVSQGLGAAHVETKARDSNHFTVSVNVEPNSLAIFNLTYEELLVRRNGVYNHAINLHPGALVPKLTVTVHLRETNKITELRVPEIRTGNEIDATADDKQNSKATIVRANDAREATITFTPDLEEQQRLIGIYIEKTKETRIASPYGYDVEEDSSDRESALGQFVVQYDVERPKNGEILVNDGYFVHFYAPSELPPLSKHCVFVLDTSGSMMDRKIVQLREAMQTILGELHSGDYFSIVEFASSVMVHELAEADEKPRMQYSPYGPFSYSEHNRSPTLVPPSEATPENVAKAKTIVSRLQAAGGTNIYSALDVAVQLIQKGVGWTNSTESGNATNDEVPQLEPIIIFLTDGDPTVGQTDPTRIINHVTEKNSGEKKATLYSLAFGEDADRKFLRKLSLRNDGFMLHIYEAADAALQLRDFYRQVSSPLLADVKFVYPKKQVKADSLTKHRFRRYYQGSETVVAGRVADDTAELTPTVGAFCGVRNTSNRTYVEITPKAPVPLAKENFLPLERLWAYLTIKQLLDERDARDPPAGDADNSTDQRALDIALKYSFVTPLTSLVVVKPNATDAVDAESVHKQNSNFGYNNPGSYPIGGLAAQPAGLSYSSRTAPMAGPPSGSLQQFLVLRRPQHSSFGWPAGGQALTTSAAQSALFSAMNAPAVALNAFDYTDTMDLAVAEEEEGIEPESPVSTPAPTTASPLEPYHLQEYEWLSSLLAGEDDIQIPTNTTTIHLKLSKDDVAPRGEGADAPCVRAADAATDAATDAAAGAGVCVYLTRCAATRDLTAASYPAFHCSVGQHGYAGVCCPKDKVDVGKNN